METTPQMKKLVPKLIPLLKQRRINRLTSINTNNSPQSLAKPFQEIKTLSPETNIYSPTHDHISASKPPVKNGYEHKPPKANYKYKVSKGKQFSNSKKSRAKKQDTIVSSSIYDKDTYQTHDGRDNKYSSEQVKSFNNAVGINSVSMVSDKRREPLDFAMRDTKYIKSKIINQKVSKTKHIVQRDRHQDYKKQIRDKHHKEKSKRRNNNNLGGSANISKKFGKMNDYTVNSNRSKLPYGLRSQLEELTLNTTGVYDSLPRDNLYPSDHISKRDHSNKNGHKNYLKSKYVDNSKGIVPTSSESLKNLLASDSKVYSRSMNKKDQDELTNRLLSHREKTESHIQILKVAIDCENGIKEKRDRSLSKKSITKEHQNPSNADEFYQNQVDLERLKRQRIVNEVESKSNREISEVKPPKINSHSRRIASNMDIGGNVHTRLHSNGNRKLILQAQEVMEELNNGLSKERSSSCERRGIMNLLSEEKDLTFKPKIIRTSGSQRRGKIGDRLLEDAYKRKTRKDLMIKELNTKIKNDQVPKSSKYSNTYAYKFFSKDFKKAVKDIDRDVEMTMDFPDL
jgi:hypothetical protein